MKMKITPEHYKAVQSYIDYINNLIGKPSVSNAGFQLVGNPSNTLQKASLKKTKSPLALPPPSNMSSLSQAERMKKAMDYDAYIMSLVRNTPTTKELAKTISQPSAATTSVVQNASKNNPFYKSGNVWIKDNPKTFYTALASLFSAPVLYSMFGGSEDTSSGIVPDGTNADSNNYKLLANKAKQDINKEYTNAHNKNTGVNTGTNTQSATQNTDKLKQLNELSARVDTNMDKLKALEEETLKRLQEQQAKQVMPITDTSNTTENVINKPVDQGTTQGTNVPEKKEIPATGTNIPKNAIGNAVKKKINQNVKKDTNNKTPTINKYTPYTPVTIPGFSSEELIQNNPEFAMPKQEFSNNTGSTPQPTKTALSEAQRDYYRYLTGYQRMSPNQAILSMGLDPTKYTY